MSQPTLALSLFFHLVATAFWVGGLLITVVTVWPESRRALGEGSETMRLLFRLRARMTPYFNLALAVLLVTGMFQMAANENYDGLMQFDNEWSRVILFKHIALVGMIISGALIQFGVAPALERLTLLDSKGKGDPAEYARLRRREVWLTWASAALGVLILAFSAWAGSL
ncbi:MAG: CopD family protein [Anaerolineae bacterium]|nr:CopD family protein [Anaerolineae bacterium]